MLYAAKAKRACVFFRSIKNGMKCVIWIVRKTITIEAKQTNRINMVLIKDSFSDSLYGLPVNTPNSLQDPAKYRAYSPEPSMGCPQVAPGDRFLMVSAPEAVERP